MAPLTSLTACGRAQCSIVPQNSRKLRVSRATFDIETWRAWTGGISVEPHHFWKKRQTLFCYVNCLMMHKLHYLLSFSAPAQTHINSCHIYWYIIADCTVFWFLSCALSHSQYCNLCTKVACERSVWQGGRPTLKKISTPCDSGRCTSRNFATEITLLCTRMIYAQH